MNKIVSYNYRNYTFETKVPVKIAEAMGLEKGLGKLEWSISKKGVVTVKRVEVEEGK